MPAGDLPAVAAPGFPRYIPALNGLRAVACLAVFGVHWQQLTGFAASFGPFDIARLLENGNTGVSFFFTLSAFLLSLHFWTGVWGQAERPWLGDYIRSRAARLLPPYYLCLGALVVLGRRWESAHERLDTLLHVFFLHNLTESTFYSLTPPFWTIAVQVQAYVVLPLIVLVTLRVFKSWTVRAWWLAGLTAAAYLAHWASLTLGAGPAGMAAWAASRPTVATDSVIGHLPHFVLGLLVGLLYVRRAAHVSSRSAFSLWRELSVWIAAAVILLILSTRLDDWFTIPYGRYNFPVVPVLVAWIILQTPETRVARAVLEATPLRLLGMVSFGVYVYHFPALRVVGRVMRVAGLSYTEHWGIFAVASLALAIFAAGFSYAFLETPFLRWIRTRPRVLTGVRASA